MKPTALAVIAIGLRLVVLDPAWPVAMDEFGRVSGIVKARFDLDPNAGELTLVEDFPPSPFVRRWLVVVEPAAPSEAGDPRWSIVSWRPLPALTVRSWREISLVYRREATE